MKNKLQKNFFQKLLTGIKLSIATGDGIIIAIIGFLLFSFITTLLLFVKF